MKRFTAMRTAKIAAAIVAPLTVMTLYLNIAHDWWSDWRLYLLCVFLLICCTPDLCTAPATEDEAARANHLYFGTLIWSLTCWLFFSWVSDQPEAAAFFASLKPRLKDWKLTTVMALLCLQLMRVGLRRALAFSMTDLYPHLRRAGKTEA